MEIFNSKITLPTEVEFIINSLYDNGYEAYVVGGCVRDSLIFKVPTDWDITTNSTPEEVKHIFEDKGLRVIETGIKHGTVSVLIEKINYEITTYRVEGDYRDNRRPSEVHFTRSLKEDLNRRDFTINALAYNNREGIIDFHNGIDDLKNKVIKTVGTADIRFEEDALRMLRAVRFSTVLEFELDNAVRKSIIKNSNLVSNISMERIRDEFVKIILSKRPSEGIQKLLELNLISFIVPELNFVNEFNNISKSLYEELLKYIIVALDSVDCNIFQRLGALLHNIQKFTFNICHNENLEILNNNNSFKDNIVLKVLKRLKFDNFTINKTINLINNYEIDKNIESKEAIKKFIIKVGIENLEDLFKLSIAIRFANNLQWEDILNLKKSCYEILKNREPLYIYDLAINGTDLISLGIKNGKFIGEVLNYLLGEVLRNPELNTKDNLLLLTKKYCKC